MHDLPSPRDIHMACARAAQFRRQAAIDAGEPAGNLLERISFLVARESRPTSESSWFEVGSVLDGVVGEQLTAYWNPETGKVRVQRPVSDDDLPTRSAPQLPALLYSIYGPKHYTADPAYRYFFEGREYSATEAEIMASERKSVEGWMWVEK